VPLFVRVWQRLYVSVATLSWSVLGVLFAVHALTSYVLFVFAGETKLTDSIVTFAYFYMTTATTVGYGDLSPGGDAGRLVNVCIVLPGSIALFTVLLGKAVAGMSAFWRRRLQGLGDFSERAGHTLVVGWQGARSRRVIEGLLNDAAPHGPRIVLLARGLDANPMPEVIDFVTAEQLGDRAAFLRAGAVGAHTIIIRGADDDETLAATLAGRSAAPDAHMVAHFHEDSAADLIRHQLPDVEVITSIAAGLLVRAARDPGASQLAALMFADNAIDNAFSLQVPAGVAGLAYLDVMVALKQACGLTLIGLCRAGGRKVDLNCAGDCIVAGGDTLFYIADHRVSPAEVDWTAIALRRAA
jgi:voltage-gated potassium channel